MPALSDTFKVHADPQLGCPDTCRGKRGHRQISRDCGSPGLRLLRLRTKWAGALGTTGIWYRTIGVLNLSAAGLSIRVWFIGFVQAAKVKSREITV